MARLLVLGLAAMIDLPTARYIRERSRRECGKSLIRIAGSGRAVGELRKSRRNSSGRDGCRRSSERRDSG